MQLLSANYAKTQFGQMIDMAQKEPVRITRHNRIVGVMVSAQDYEDMRAFYANRLKNTLQATATQARAKGCSDGAADTARAASHDQAQSLDGNQRCFDAHAGAFFGPLTALSSLRDKDQRCTSEGPS